MFALVVGEAGVCWRGVAAEALAGSVDVWLHQCTVRPSSGVLGRVNRLSRVTEAQAGVRVAPMTRRHRWTTWPCSSMVKARTRDQRGFLVHPAEMSRW